MPSINHRRMITDAADEASVATGRRYFYDTAGDDKIAGSDGNDFFVVSDGGDDVLRGGGGDDGFLFFETFTSADRVNGGNGIDTIKLSGSVDDYVLPIELAFQLIKRVERIVLGGNAEYFVVIGDGFSDLVLSSKFRASTINIDAQQLSTGNVKVISGSSSDTVIGSQGNDHIRAGGGNDVLTGGVGSDVFVYPSASESRPNSPDLITDFSHSDSINLPRIGMDYHFGASQERTGDILTDYDISTDKTTLQIFTNSDDDVDMILMLTGQYVSMEISQHHTIVIS